jgi:nucleotide-binding universal stress UspA family protein
MVIVVGYTPRPESRAALDAAVEEARRHGARLHLVRTLGQGPSENPSQTRAWANRSQQTSEEIRELAERLAADGLEVTFDVEPVSAAPAEHLLEVAHQLGADLIVIGLRRRSPVGKLVMGSVSQQILLGAECPVLAVKAPGDD